MLIIKNLDKSFEDKPILNDANLVINKGEKIALIEEYLPGENTFEDDDAIRATTIGSVNLDSNEKIALEALVKTLDDCSDEMLPEDIQTLIYSTGKENGYSENLRDWFKLIYEVVFGDENGPRMGFFISFFGVKETKELITEKIK